MAHHKNQKPEDWMDKKWRPLMGYMYMSVCVFDFMIFPILWSMLQAHDHGQVTSQWQPLTLQGAGLFHVAMGAVLGITAYGRTREKIFGANGEVDVDPISFGSNAGTTYIPPNSAGYVNVTSNNTAPQDYGNHNSFNTNTATTISPQSGSVQAPVFGSTPLGPPRNQFPER